jgi:hypothetical protein
MKKRLYPRDQVSIPNSVFHNLWELDAELVKEYLPRQRIFNASFFSELGLGAIQCMTNDYRSLFIEQDQIRALGKSLSDMYSFNSHGYRSEEFSDTHEGLHVLFAGCSITFGEGLFLEDTWPKLVYDELSKTNTMSGFFNIGTRGASRSYVMYQIEKYIDRYGCPDIIFVNFPDPYRDYNQLQNKETSTDSKLNYDFFRSITTPVIAMTWDSHLPPVWSDGSEMTKAEHAEVMQNLEDLPGLIKIDYKELNRYIKDYEMGDLKPDYLRWRSYDLAHPGIAEHRFYAKTILDNLSNFNV